MADIIPFPGSESSATTLNDQRLADGVFYTPAVVARYIVDQTLGRAMEKKSCPLRILDPACGAGIFLIEAYRYLLQRMDASNVAAQSWQSLERRRRLLLDCIFGVELDPAAVAATRKRLAEEALAPLKTEPREYGLEVDRLCWQLEQNIRCGDALIGLDYKDSAESGFDWSGSFQQVTDQGGFDVVLANPPYVNIRRLTKARGPRVNQYLREHYRCAFRGYDLYVLFLEKGQQLLRPGGHCGVIVPNKLATLDYAAPCREMLLSETVLLRIDDLSRLDVFPEASVYPFIFIWQKIKPAADHKIAVAEFDSLAQLARGKTDRLLRQETLSAEQGWHIHGSLELESRVVTVPLAACSRLHCGAAGFSARATADDLIETSQPREAAYEFIVSGNIDRYAISLGDVRFMKRRYARPRLPKDAACLTAHRRWLYDCNKIVIAGMTKRLEAAWDGANAGQGLALGVQVYAATDIQGDPRYLLGLLNSKLLSYLFRLRFSAKQLSGGYLSINKSQLARLPIRRIETGDRQALAQQARIIELVEQLQQLNGSDKGKQDQSLFTTIDQQIDAGVYQLYQLTDDEIANVEASFCKQVAKGRAA